MKSIINQILLLLLSKLLFESLKNIQKKISFMIEKCTKYEQQNEQSKRNDEGNVFFFSFTPYTHKCMKDSVVSFYCCYHYHHWLVIIVH